VDHGVDQIAFGVGEDMALAALDLLARVIARGPPLSVLFTLWLSGPWRAAERRLALDRDAVGYLGCAVARPQPLSWRR